MRMIKSKKCEKGILFSRENKLCENCSLLNNCINDYYRLNIRTDPDQIIKTDDDTYLIYENKNEFNKYLTEKIEKNVEVKWLDGYKKGLIDATYRWKKYLILILEAMEE